MAILTLSHVGVGQKNNNGHESASTLVLFWPYSGDFLCLFILKILAPKILQRAPPHVQNLSIYSAMPVWHLKLRFPNHYTKKLRNVHENKKSPVFSYRRNQPSCSGISQSCFSVCLSDSFILRGNIHLRQSLPHNWNNISKWSGWRYRNRAGQ